MCVLTVVESTRGWEAREGPGTLVIIVLSAAFIVCSAPAVGMETGDIRDSQLTASTGDPSGARLKGSHVWCTDWPGRFGGISPGDANGYIQVI